MDNREPSLKIIHQELFHEIRGIDKVHLSLAQYASPTSRKELVLEAHSSVGRLTPEEHITSLLKQRRLIASGQPILVLSVRNVMANQRCIAYVNGLTEGLLGVTEEVFTPNRPYYILGSRDNKIVMETFTPEVDDEQIYDWFVSGVPVAWDNWDKSTTLSHIAAEASDHSHIWHIPRGGHPEATDTTRNHWKELHDIFEMGLTGTTSEVSDKMRLYAETRQLYREKGYLHNVISVNSQGSLLQLIKKGTLESIGKEITQKDTSRAIMMDNSGSITVHFYPKGIDHLFIELLAAPNRREPGTAYLLMELTNKYFI